VVLLLIKRRVVRHDVSNIRRRVKHATKQPAGSQEDLPLEDPSLPLWSSVETSLSLRTSLSPPPRNLDTLGVFRRPDPIPICTTTLKVAQTIQYEDNLGNRTILAYRSLLRNRCLFPYYALLGEGGGNCPPPLLEGRPSRRARHSVLRFPCSMPPRNRLLRSP